MANTVEECEVMIAAAKKSGKKLAVAHPQRYFNAIAKMKEIYDSGELGTFCMCTGTRSIDYFADWRPRWFLSKKAAGGGIVMNYGAHELDKIQYITGARVEKVYSNCENIKNDYDIEGHAQIFGKLDNGATFALTFSGYSPAAYDNIFYFTKGAMRANSSHTLEVNRGKGWEKFAEIDTDGKEMERELTEFVKFINGEDANIPDAEFGRDVIAAIEKIYESNI
jgi:predicted dehydrogenase